MKSKKRLVSIALALIIVGGSCYLAMAGEPSNNPPESSSPRYIGVSTSEVLVGLKGINAIVEDIRPEVEKNGLLTKEAIQTIVELELRKFGIKVLSEKERLGEPGMAFLYVNLNCQIGPYNRYWGAITVQLQETVMLKRQPGTWILNAIVWSGGGIFENSEPQAVREYIKNNVDKFINDYLAANPKEPVVTKDANNSSNH